MNSKGPEPVDISQVNGRSSPYLTGGGRVVLVYRYGAFILSYLLTGDPLSELGSIASISRASF